MSAIKMYSNVEFAENSSMTFDISQTTFPENPTPGRSCVVNGVLYFFTSIDGEEPVWVPLGTKRLNAVVNVDEPQLEWIIEHNLATFDLVASVYDVNNKLLDAPFTIISANIIKYTFTNPVKGKAVVFGASQKYAGFTPNVSQLTGETLSVGTGEPTSSTTSTLYIQIDNPNA